jgi:hypothetical protein
MNQLFLQVPQQQGVIDVLMNYGVLGVFALLMIGVIYYMSKQFVSLNKKNEDRIVELEKRLETYLVEDRATLMEAVMSNNHVIENNTALMKQLVQIVEKLEKND